MIKKRYFFLVLVVLLFFFQALLWFSKGGVLDYWQARNYLDISREENNQLRQRNNVLKAEIVNLQTELEAVEAKARNDLGLLKQDETFYQIIEPSQQPKLSPRSVIKPSVAP